MAKVNFFRNFTKLFLKIFRRRKSISLGFYGPPNAGKTSLANRICKDWTGENLGVVSQIPHETRIIQFKEKVEIQNNNKKIIFKLVDTPGIATKIDYEDFIKYGIKKKDAQKRAKEATQGVIDAIKWIEDMEAVVVVLDSSKNPYSQVNITILGNLVARKIPVLIAANKMDIKKSDIKRVRDAFPEYKVIGVSAKTGQNMEDFYDQLFKLVR